MLQVKREIEGSGGALTDDVGNLGMTYAFAETPRPGGARVGRPLCGRLGLLSIFYMTSLCSRIRKFENVAMFWPLLIP
ncbi:hypothetical protein GOP47_0021713 [Adiantum capillus-veneris]|uniref:Uncharacterized protein n=1 Tax=Adiantum capillus-veneris TaxID=13818 RepID=A0A9D4UA37_ADICA|nr:hypothetical protein GOP47_0021713 [Adiantum capillus-veneris]